MKISGVYRNGSLLFVTALWLIYLFGPAMVAVASEGSGGGGVTVTPDGSLLIQIVNFIFTIWVLNFLLFKPIRKILIQRKNKVDGLKLSIETSEKDAREKDDAFAAGIKEARALGSKEKDALLLQAADEEKRIIDGINQKAFAELSETRAKIAADSQAVGEVLRKKIDDFASQITQKILGRTV
jgi:F-type H+-transporting ATPase subunit b